MIRRAPHHNNQEHRAPVVYRHADCGGELVRCKWDTGERQCDRCEARVDVGIAAPTKGGRQRGIRRTTP